MFRVAGYVSALHLACRSFVHGLIMDCSSAGMMTKGCFSILQIDLGPFARLKAPALAQHLLLWHLEGICMAASALKNTIAPVTIKALG